MHVSFIAIAMLVRTNQKPNSVRRRDAPPHTIWFLICPHTGEYSHKSRKRRSRFLLWC
jgi:hypothetical protein